MWITPDVNIPNGLLEAHRENRLVVFAGAGVSVDQPSGLPLFERLAHCIGEQTGHVPSEIQLKNPDRFLGDLSEHTDVHRLASNIIGKDSSSPNALHHAILRLTTAGDGNPRIVTTNYDLHLSTAADLEEIRLQRFDGPALPMGNDFSGIVHLHGSLDQDPRRLVLTDKDFGRAYLTDAWAAQFLHRMFRQYTVLFVGYSHSDMVMEYLARGLPRGTERYALTRDDEVSKWRRLEIHPIAYPVAAGEQHTALNEVVIEWAERADSGLLSQRQRISDLVNGPPPEDPVRADYLEEALATEHTAAFFTEFARGEAWLAWAETQHSFKALATDTQSALSLVLARWFVTNFVMLESETHRALRTVQILGGRIGRVLWSEIALGLFRSKEVRPSTFKAWVALLLEADHDNQSGLLFYLLNSCKWPGDRATALLLLGISRHRTLRWLQPFQLLETSRASGNTKSGLW
ncbi:SIR2 family protein [Arthrobacter sp. S2(2024)]|uniref:SIR2 family protein n=1 Tax=Arthrobacter sp. S2(2024) TaxID=3111911 RepID=UPI002FC65E29